jgi:hypothetical protein
VEIDEYSKRSEGRNCNKTQQKGPEKSDTRSVPFRPYINPSPELHHYNQTRIEKDAAAAAAAAMSTMKFCREWYARAPPPPSFPTDRFFSSALPSCCINGVRF